MNNFYGAVLKFLVRSNLAICRKIRYNGTRIVFLNTKGTIGDISEDTKAFLDYIEGQVSDNPFIKELEKEVMRVKSNGEWRRQYMRTYLRDRANWKLAKDEGKDEKAIEVVENGLKNNISVETISIMTGLSIQEIEKLKEKIDINQ